MRGADESSGKTGEARAFFWGGLNFAGVAEEKHAVRSRDVVAMLALEMEDGVDGGVFSGGKVAGGAGDGAEESFHADDVWDDDCGCNCDDADGAKPFGASESSECEKWAADRDGFEGCFDGVWVKCADVFCASYDWRGRGWHGGSRGFPSEFFAGFDVEFSGG